MSDFTYNCVFAVGYSIISVSSDPVVLHADRAKRQGAYILAANHLSPFDVPLLMAHTRRHLDFMSIVEMQRIKWVRRLYDRMNCFYVDRSRRDPGAVHAALDRLARGRVVAMFPESGIQSWETSVLNGGAIRPGVAKLAQMADVPVVPAVVLGSSDYVHARNWLPLRRTRVGVIFGEPMKVGKEGDRDELRGTFLAQLKQTMVALSRELNEAMRRHHGVAPLPEQLADKVNDIAAPFAPCPEPAPPLHSP